MKAKRVTLVRMRAYDAKHDSCIVREIEMLQDMCIQPVLYTIQFWRDVTLYGLDEAITYLAQYDASSNAMLALRSRANEVIRLVNTDQ